RRYNRRAAGKPRPRARTGARAGRRPVPGRSPLLAADRDRARIARESRTNCSWAAPHRSRNQKTPLPQRLKARVVEKPSRFLRKTHVLLPAQLANDVALVHALFAKLALAQGGS